MPGSGLSQWPRWAGGGARARWDLGLRAGGGREEEGSGQERRGAAAAAAAAKRPCCVVCGAGGGGGGSKAERGDGRETPHTHGTRWPERQQHPELSGVPPWPRDPPVGGELRPGGPQARGSQAAAARDEMGRAPGSDPRGGGARNGRAHNAERAAAAAAAEAPRGPGGPARRGRQAPRGKRARATWRCRRQRPDPVSSAPAPFIVLCPWEGTRNVLERASGRGWRAGPRGRLSADPAGAAGWPPSGQRRRARGRGCGGPAADPAGGGGRLAARAGRAGRGAAAAAAGGRGREPEAGRGAGAEAPCRAGEFIVRFWGRRSPSRGLLRERSPSPSRRGGDALADRVQENNGPWPRWKKNKTSCACECECV